MGSGRLLDSTFRLDASGSRRAKSRFSRSIPLVMVLWVGVALAEPRRIEPSEAGGFVDEVVVVEGLVRSARVREGRVWLEFVESDRFRIVLSPALTAEPAAGLAGRFVGQRVRAQGRIRQFDGFEEMHLSSDSRIEILRAGVSESTDKPGPTASAVPLPSPDATNSASSCARALEEWRSRSSEAGSKLQALQKCLTKADPPCVAELEPLLPGLAELAAAEARWRWLCEGTR